MGGEVGRKRNLPRARGGGSENLAGGRESINNSEKVQKRGERMQEKRHGKTGKSRRTSRLPKETVSLKGGRIGRRGYSKSRSDNIQPSGEGFGYEATKGRSKE